MFDQPVEPSAERCHWYERVGTGEPVQVPSVEVSAAPTRRTPEIVGGAEFPGSPLSSTPVGQKPGVVPLSV